MKKISTASPHTSGALTHPRPLLVWGIMTLCLGLGIAYIVNMNAQSTTGFVLRQREEARATMAREVQGLEQELSILSSIGIIETAARSMDLVTSGDAHYAVPEAGVAIGNAGTRP